MPRPLRDIPPLIPLPVSKDAEADAEADADKFATLFEPSTPRASPIFPAADASSYPRQSHPRTPGSASSDFGAFVGVPVDRDPLSLDNDGFGDFGSAPAANDGSGFPSLDFFDNARRASEANKHQVLDELLAHEDDPLYNWMHPVRQGNNAERTGGEDLLLDLRPATPPPRSPSVPASPPRDDPTDMARPSLPRSTTSPPPLSSSNSYGSIGTLSSRFMSTLLSTSRAAPASTSPDAHRARDTQFTHEHGASEPLRTHSQSHMPIHAQTLPASSAPSTFLQSSAISHGTPFGAPLPVQASGAPGFSIAQDRAWDKKGFSDDFDREKVERRSLTLAGRGAATTAVLSTTLADLIRPYCPALARLPRTWSLLYSLDQHGISLKTLYTRCSLDFRAQQKGKGTALVGEAGMLLVVRDAGDAVFGAFVGDGIRCEKGYYGSGESFLWKYVDGKLRVFKWTGRNDYVALCEPDYISFGGGDGHYGLYLDDTLYDGSSARCPTFDNEPLGSGVGKTFECVGLEVWGIGP